MEKATRFEELWIWQQARLIVRQIYGDCSIGPASRDFGFRDQILRAGVSIMNNVAEGFERSTGVRRFCTRGRAANHHAPARGRHRVVGGLLAHQPFDPVT
jgi:23S rRNA-intervening sequence protein